jgi:hypothetical protein
MMGLMLAQAKEEENDDKEADGSPASSHVSAL